MMLRTLPIVLLWALSSAVASHGQKASSQPGAAPAAAPSSSELESMANEELLALAERMLAAQQLQEATPLLDLVLRRDPTNTHAMVLVGEFNEAMGQVNAALESYFRAIRNAPEDFRANFGLGRIFLAPGSFDMAQRAVLHLEQAERSAPPNRRADVLALLSRAYLVQGNRAMSLGAAERAVAEDGEHYEALLSLVAIRTEMQQFDLAAVDSERLVALAEELTRRAPTEAATLKRLQQAYDARMYALRQAQQATQLVSAGGPSPLAQERADPPPLPEAPVVPINPDAMSIDELVTTAQQLFAARQMQPAAQLLGIAMQRDPRNLQVVLTLGEFSEATGDMNTARESYRRVLEANATDFRANLGMGRIFLSSRGTGMARQATEYLDRAERVAPADRLSEVLSLLAKAYKAQGQRIKAIEIAERALEKDRDNYDAWEILATIRTDLAHYDKALTDSQALVDLAARWVREKPTDMGALRRLDGALDTRIATLRQTYRGMQFLNAAGEPTDELLPGKQDEAVATLLHLIEARQRQMELKSLMTRHELAVLAQRAADHDPKNTRALLQLGTLLRSVFRNAQAVVAFQKVLEIDPANGEAQRQLAELGAPAAPPRPATGANPTAPTNPTVAGQDPGAAQASTP